MIYRVPKRRLCAAGAYRIATAPWTSESCGGRTETTACCLGSDLPRNGALGLMSPRTATQPRPAVRRPLPRRPASAALDGEEDRSERAPSKLGVCRCVSEDRTRQRRDAPPDAGRKKGRTPGVPSGVRHKRKSQPDPAAAAVPNGTQPRASVPPPERGRRGGRMPSGRRVVPPHPPTLHDILRPPLRAGATHLVPPLRGPYGPRH
jgi:hypothetical protein